MLSGLLTTKFALIVHSGSVKEHLHVLALDIFHTAKDNNSDMEVEWIPRTQNERADYLSKIVDYDDWTVKNCYFHAVTSVWGPCSVDCFASYKNHKVPRFYFNPDSLGVDSLAFSWVGETCWLVPPVSLVKKVIFHICLCRCRGILVVPYWPSAITGPFWWKAGVFSSHLLQIVSTLRMVRIFFSIGIREF